MNVSIVIPAYNEADNIPELVDEILASGGPLPGLEIVLVDDGSSDGTWEAIGACARKSDCVRGLHLDGRHGKTAAMLVGLRSARGDVLITMDADLQNDPCDLPKLLQELERADAVCGVRVNRDGGWSRRAASRVANRVRNLATHDGVRDTACGFKAFRRECMGDLPQLEGVHRFMPAYFKLNGRRVVETPVKDRPRRHGESKYINLGRLPGALADLLGFLWYRSRFRLPRTAGSTAAPGGVDAGGRDRETGPT